MTIEINSIKQRLLSARNCVIYIYYSMCNLKTINIPILCDKIEIFSGLGEISHITQIMNLDSGTCLGSLYNTNL